ncbi:MAG: outer membrane beta-barrel protein [Bacteroidetes bacterium]|nr:outer membrane beta-barrel protein [Bacteroidota bacterium]
MRTLITALACSSFLAAAAQFQLNPQIGLTYQDLTSGTTGTTFKGAVGWQLGADMRIGDRLFFQPGAFLGRNATVISVDDGEHNTIENDLVRTNLKLKALAGYRIIDGYNFDLRFMAGPSYDVLLSVDNKNDAIGWNKGDFNNGSFNIDAGLGFDLGYFTLEPSASFGLSRAFKDTPALKDLSSKYITYGLTIGVNFGDDDK